MLLDLPPRGQKPEGRATPAFSQPLRDRMEEADRRFFERVEQGYLAIAAAEPKRVRVLDASQSVEAVSARSAPRRVMVTGCLVNSLMVHPPQT